MAPSVEILITPNSSETALAMLNALRGAVTADGCKLRDTQYYEGKADVLILYGVGAPERDLARNKHVTSGRHVLMFDQGYFHRKKVVGYLRCSIDHDHPQAWLDRTPADPARWDALNIQLREDADPKGHIVLVGLGRKSRSYLRLQDWETLRLGQLRKRFPGRDIVYRPKPGSPPMKLICRMDEHSTIEQLLKGAVLVSCRHSNVAIDAAVAGVPFEADDGAAMWLQAKPYTRENRLDFLQRLAWWQWRATEAAQAWQFSKGMLSGDTSGRVAA